jgi:hypothetical protein
MRYGLLVACFALVVVPFVASRAAGQQSIPDLRGTWKGQSESVVRGGGGTTHHEPGPLEPRFNAAANGKVFIGNLSGLQMLLEEI